VGRIQLAVAAFVLERGWPSTSDAEEGTVSFAAGGEHGGWVVRTLALEDREQLVLHSLLEVDVPVARREAMALFVTRANFGLVLGNFELDLDDGELRFKTSIDVEGTELTAALLDPLVLANIAMVNRYLPGIRAVASGADPADAIAAVEHAG
jgi:hypothetical protein